MNISYTLELIKSKLMQFRLMQFKLTQFKLEYVLSFVIFFFILIWISSGYIFTTKNKNDNNDYKFDNSLSTVQTKNVSAQDKRIMLNTYGVVNAKNILEIKSQISGKVLNVIAKEGSEVKSGDIILVIDNRRQDYALKSALALLEQRKAEYVAEEEMMRKGYSAKVKLSTYFTQLKDAEYLVKNAEIDLENTVIKSPIDGVVDKIYYKNGDLISVFNTVLTRVHSLREYVVSTFVSEKHVLDLEVGVLTYVTFADKRVLEGNITFISKIADPNTRTYRVDVSVYSNELIPVGMTASLDLPLRLFKSYYVGSDSLFLDDSGLVGIKILNSENVVSFIPVDVLSEEDGGFWIKPETSIDTSVTLITLGGSFIMSGEKVAIQ